VTAVTPHRRWSRTLLSVGLVFVLGGLAALTYVGWELLGTNVVAHHRQHRLIEDVRQRWAQAGDQKGLDGQTPKGKADALVRIPAFGRHYVVPVLEGVDEDVLAQGYGHYEGTAEAGQRGNYALAAHRVTHGEPLRRMPELRPGDEVIIETRTANYTYVLDTDPNKLEVERRQTWVIEKLPHNPAVGPEPRQVKGQRLLTLTTCAELFHTDERMVAFGHLESVERKTAATAHA
jgi:sortase A